MQLIRLGRYEDERQALGGANVPKLWEADGAFANHSR